MTADAVRRLKNMQWHCSRCNAGLYIGSLPDGKHPKLCGVFTRDAKDPNANGRPHWSTTEGGHLYYSITGGAWYLSRMFAPDFLNPNKFTPDKDNAAAYFVTAGEVPTGEAAWQYWDGNAFVERKLTVAELSPAEVVEAARAAAAEPHDTGCSTVARKDWFAQATGL